MQFPGRFRYFAPLVMFSGIILLILLAILKFIPGALSPMPVFISFAGFVLISAIVFFIFFSGKEEDPEKRVFRTYISVGVKMLLSFVFAFVFFLVFKFTRPSLVVLFFVLYLGFTLFIGYTFRSFLKK